MARLSLEMPWPPSVNSIWRRSPTGAVYVTKIAKKYREHAAWLVQQHYREIHDLGFAEGRIGLCIQFYPPTNGVHDIDNVQKVLLDACTQGGLWTDDNQVWEIHAFKHEAFPPHGKVEMEVWKIHQDVREGPSLASESIVGMSDE